MMRVIVDANWDENQSIIRRWCFYPWLLYTVCVIFSFNLFLKYEDPALDHDFFGKGLIKVLLSILTLFLIFVQVAVEVIQLGNRWEDYVEYIRSFYNVADLLQLSITAVVVIWGLFNGSDPIERPTIRIVAAFSIILLGNKVFDWLRLFDGTAFFIKLLHETLREIVDFMILFLSALMMFGMAIYLIAQNMTDGGLVQPSKWWFVFDIMLNQYLLSLGEFADLDGYQAHD